MIITHKKGIKLNGKNPTILYGYGGLILVSLHHLYSQRSLDGTRWNCCANQGSGEYGKKWHKAGTKMKKQMFLMILLLLLSS